MSMSATDNSKMAEQRRNKLSGHCKSRSTSIQEICETSQVLSASTVYTWCERGIVPREKTSTFLEWFDVERRDLLDWGFIVTFDKAELEELLTNDRQELVDRVGAAVGDALGQEVYRRR